ncbi:MAG: O-antigen ligase family protein [Candidatus Sericytochromatia bacterium]
MGLLLALLVAGLASALPLWHIAGWLSRYLLPALLIWGSYRALASGRLNVSDVLWGLLGGSLLLAGVGLGAYFGDWSLHPQLLCLRDYGQPCLIDLLLLPETRARSFSMHPNVLGACLLVVLPLWVWVLGRARGLHKLPVAFGLACVTLCLLVTYSRAAWLGALPVTLIALALWLNASWRQSLLVVTAGGLGVAAWRGQLILLQARLESFLAPTQGSGGSRLQLWRNGLDMLQDHLWWGVGLLQVEPVYALYRRGGEAVGHLHNWPLQVAVESGLPLMLAVFVCLGLLLGDPRRLTPLGQAAWLACLGFGLSALLDCTLLDIRVSFVLCHLLGLLLFERQQAQRFDALRRSLGEEA